MKFILYSRWEQLPEHANILFTQAEQDSLFFSRIWLENLTAHSLAEQQTLLLACVVEDESFLAILPLIKHPQNTLSALSNNFTSLYSLLVCNNKQQDAALKCLANGLANDPSLAALQPIVFEPVDSNDDNIKRLRELMETFGFKSQFYFRFYNWMHPLKGQTFNQYMADRPANLRNTIKRKKSKLEREHKYDIRLFTNNDIDLALTDYETVYKASWKANEFFTDFTPAMVRSLSQKGCLRLAILYVDEQAIAAQIWFVVHGKANIYRLVYNENWKRYSPGSILTEYLMRYAIDTDMVTEIDFLTGNEQYKQDWMTIRRERVGIRFAKPRESKKFLSRAIESISKRLSIN